MSSRKTPPECSVRDGKYALCPAMKKYLVSNSMVSRQTKGLINMDNLMNFDTGSIRSIGPVYRSGGKDPGILFNFCPWCGSDIEKNWRVPEEKRVAKAASNTAAAKKKKKKKKTAKKTAKKGARRAR